MRLFQIVFQDGINRLVSLVVLSKAFKFCFYRFSFILNLGFFVNHVINFELIEFLFVAHKLLPHFSVNSLKHFNFDFWVRLFLLLAFYLLLQLLLAALNVRVQLGA